MSEPWKCFIINSSTMWNFLWSLISLFSTDFDFFSNPFSTLKDTRELIVFFLSLCVQNSAHFVRQAEGLPVDLDQSEFIHRWTWHKKGKKNSVSQSLHTPCCCSRLHLYCVLHFTSSPSLCPWTQFKLLRLDLKDKNRMKWPPTKDILDVHWKKKILRVFLHVL